MSAAFEFYKRCKKAGLKYIPGEEFYMAKESRHERPKRNKAKVDDTGGDTEEGQKLYYHITMLAETNEGFHNMIKLSSKAFLEGFHYKPRVDWEMLEEFHEGIIATSGCLGGLVLQALLNNNMDEAKKRASRLQDIFGKENFFMELQNHGLQEQIKTNPQLLEIAKYLNAPLLATNDSHYVHSHDAIAHDALLCVQTGSLISDVDRFKFQGEEHYLKSSAEMRYLFSELPESCDNTLWIAERSNVTLDSPGYKLPKFPCPAGFEDDNSYLAYLVNEGAKKRWGIATPEANARIEFELNVVRNMGFPSYFLILWDIVRHAHENSIATGPGRGSAAGSVISYCLGITELDPIEHDLLFERFLNPSRISMPDIDLDIDSRFRDTLIRYAAEKYGEDKVAQIITFSQIKARAAVRDSARVLGFGYATGDKIAKAMPPVVMGRDTPLWACLKEDPAHSEGYENATEIRNMYKYNDEAKSTIDVALGLEGLRRSDGIHAAAVVISDKPLVEYLPIQRKGEGKPIVTQYEMNNVEELGLLKMDFLSLACLDALDITQKSLRARGVDVDVNKIPMDNYEAFKILQEAKTTGIFQLESGPIRDLLRRLAPSEFKDIAALVALYRPGPMASNMHNDYVDRKNGRQYIEYFHDDAEPILEDTYGLMIYQEQMMRIAQKFAGYSLAEADNLRKACGKKIRELMAKEKDKLIDGVVTQGYGEELANMLWGMIEPFADYSFNKSHAYSYGYIAYQTAYFKANYPVEYIGALLTCSTSDSQRVALHMGEAKKLGITVLPPHINESDYNFKPIYDSNVILFGLEGVKNVNEGVVEKILEIRPFTSFGDFVERMVKEGFNRKSIESFIYGGALDSFGLTRRAMVDAVPGIQKDIKKRIKDEAKGAVSLFPIESVAVANAPEYEPKERLEYEKNNLGVYISDHPLNRIAHMYDDPEITPLIFLRDHSEWTSILGMISEVKLLRTRKGEAMATIAIEDLNSRAEIVIFPKPMKNCGSIVKVGNIIRVRGRLDARDEHYKFIATTVTLVEQE